MKKIILTLTLAMAIIASTALAGDYDFVKGGARGYVSSYSDVSAFIQLKAGDDVTIMNLNTEITLSCGIGRLAGELEKAGYDSFQYTAPASDLYLFFCIKKAGTSGDTIIAIIDTPATRKAEIETRVSEEDLKILTEKWGKKFSE